MRTCRFLWLVLPVVAMTIGGCFAPRQDAVEEKQNPKGGAVNTEMKQPLAGSTSCAGRACHGRLERTKDPDSKYTLDEFTTWVTTDPHVNAYHVLEMSRSQEIAQRMNLKEEAHESPRCLACHTTPEAAVKQTDPDLEAHVRQERTLGVGCEACHGNAKKWFGPHIETPWTKKNADEKTVLGFVEITKSETLARRCVGCHVGSKGDSTRPDRDVNHDLIAAGHPRLNFEFSTYFHNLPVHWQPKKFPHVERWAVGQLVSAEAALDLLEYRAGANGGDDRVWPEFSEYDCFGCHHNLTHDPNGPVWRQAPDRPRNNRRRDALTWGSWYFAVPRSLAELPHLKKLTDVMEVRRPDPAKVAKVIDKTREDLRALHKEVQKWTEDSAPARIKALRFGGPVERDWSWDAAEQTFLSLYALNQVAQDMELQARLDLLLPIRAFPPGFNSTRSLPPDHPNRFSPEEFFKTLRGGAPK